MGQEARDRGGAVQGRQGRRRRDEEEHPARVRLVGRREALPLPSGDHRVVLLDRARALRQTPAVPVRHLPHRSAHRQEREGRHQVLAQVRQVLEEVLRARAVQDHPGHLLTRMPVLWCETVDS